MTSYYHMFCVILQSELSGQELQSGHFRLGHIIAATSNFSSANKIGEGGFGPVYKASLLIFPELTPLLFFHVSKQNSRKF